MAVDASGSREHRNVGPSVRDLQSSLYCNMELPAALPHEFPRSVFLARK